MSIDRKIGLELRDGQGVGRDPDQMTAEELIALGHSDGPESLARACERGTAAAGT
jgi:hypothetical protein